MCVNVPMIPIIYTLGNDLQYKWRKLVDKFRLEYRKFKSNGSSGSAASEFKSSFVHWKRIQFLNDQLEYAATSGSLKEVVKAKNAEISSDDNVSSDGLYGSDSDSDDQPNLPAKKARKRNFEYVEHAPKVEVRIYYFRFEINSFL